MSLGKLTGSSWKFYHRRNFKQGSPCYILEVTWIQTGYGLLIRTRFCLAEVCSLTDIFNTLMFDVFVVDDGISIPCQYTSYLAPLSSSKLWNEARSCRDPNKPVEVRHGACFLTGTQHISDWYMAQCRARMVKTPAVYWTAWIKCIIVQLLHNFPFLCFFSSRYCIVLNIAVNFILSHIWSFSYERFFYSIDKNTPCHCVYWWIFCRYHLRRRTSYDYTTHAHLLKLSRSSASVILTIAVSHL